MRHASSISLAAPGADTGYRPRRSLLVRLLSFAGLWRSRNRLGDLDERMLSDIGVSRTEARRESQRPIWDVPSNWRV